MHSASQGDLSAHSCVQIIDIQAKEFKHSKKPNWSGHSAVAARGTGEIHDTAYFSCCHSLLAPYTVFWYSPRGKHSSNVMSQALSLTALPSCSIAHSPNHVMLVACILLQQKTCTLFIHFSRSSPWGKMTHEYTRVQLLCI